MNNWKIGTKIWFGIWFGICIPLQLLVFIEYITKPNTAYALVYGISALAGIVLYLWLAVGHSKAALTIIMIVAVINAVSGLISTGLGSALLSLIVPTITFLLTRNNVE